MNKKIATMLNPVWYRGFRIEVRNTSPRFMPARYAAYVTKNSQVQNLDASGADTRENAVTLAKMEIDTIADRREF